VPTPGGGGGGTGGGGVGTGNVVNPLNDVSGIKGKLRSPCVAQSVLSVPYPHKCVMPISGSMWKLEPVPPSSHTSLLLNGQLSSCTMSSSVRIPQFSQF